jgi:hypothetical protein
MFSSEIKQSKSSSGSPSDSENKKNKKKIKEKKTQEIKARNQDKIGKKYVPQYGRQFCYWTNW